MICPQCKKEQFCPCESCKYRLGDNIPWIWKREVAVDEITKKQFDFDTISCGYCGLTMHEDSWMDEEQKQYKEKQSYSSHTPNNNVSPR